MPSEVMDQRRLSFFSEELLFPSERQVGFWKPEIGPDHQGTEGMSLISGSKSLSSSPMEKLQSVGPRSVEGQNLSRYFALKNQSTKSVLEQHLVGAGNNINPSMTSWRACSQEFALRPNLCLPTSLFIEGNKVDMDGSRYENGLFSSSLSELLDRKSKLSSNVANLGQSVDHVNSNPEEGEPFRSLEEIEAQTIGNLLPDDDDLLSGLIDGIGVSQAYGGDDIEDDIFCTGGGMELEGDDNCNSSSNLVNGDSSNGLLGGINRPFAGEHPYGEHPSRTLFVRNINGNVEDTELKMLFEQYGDIHTLYTACKNRGFVMISFYDIRASQNAMISLQNKPLRGWKLDIHFSIPKDNPSDKDNQGTLVVFNLDSSISNDDLHQIFGVYGEIKEICETPHKNHHKFIEFYDVRDADAALRGLNRSDVAGKKIKVEPSRPEGAKQSLMPQLSTELELEESSGCRQGISPSSSPPGFYGSVPLRAVTSDFNDGTDHSLRSAIRAPINPLLDSAVHGIPSGLVHNLSFPVRVTSRSNHSNSSLNSENGHSFGQVKFGFQGMPIMHPHSLPEYHDGLSSGVQYNSSNAMPAMAININPRTGEGIDSRYIQRAGSGSLSHSLEGGNGSCPVHGHPNIWNNSNPYPHQSAGIWGTSPSFMNNVPSHHHPQMHGIRRAPSHIMNNVLPLHPHHVGSAPAVNPSLWDRRQTYIGDFTDAPSFHPGSLGSMRFSHPLELDPHNIFPHSGGSCFEQVGIPSPQQRCRMFQGRNQIIPMPASFDSPHDRIRSRRSDPNANQGDNKKQYELDIERIIRAEDSRTTLMIKNIPNKYTSKMLLAAIDEHHKGTYDFIYLPIDFKNKCNVGYAFINMIDPKQIIPFFQAFNGKKWEKFNSEKVASLAYARIQGKTALIAHFQNSSLMNEDKRCRPILFHSDGPNAGDQEPFPVGTNVRSRPGRSRTHGSEENNHFSPSTSPNAAGFSNGTDITSSIKDVE
ncbi:protein MEI2-like 4 isoform X2 [Asparagus officinalis]|uniref:protein MEI2-like 4 isoform X2 n=1 Tax=Asparagus officinalis TaxID=4686 RepID=UPI00098E4FF7|nr:protein MEI2-like 4 isoform X2 [Asparagus officinalis]